MVAMQFPHLSRLLFTAVLFSPAILFAQRPQQRLPEGTVAKRDIPYVTKGHDLQKLDLFLPKSADPAKPLPLVIWVHGGAWRAGTKDNCPALRLLEKGYAVASIGYRLTDTAIYPAQLEDCKSAVRWLRSHAKEHGLDPQRFAAWGSSAGGHLVALLGTTGEVKEYDKGENLEVGSEVQAVVDFFGPIDFCQMEAQDSPEFGKIDHDAANSPESLLVGGAIQENKGKVAKASPLTYITKNDPPVLMVHGDRDPLVPHGQSELFAAALKKAGITNELKTVKGGGHGNGFPPEVQDWVDGFLSAQLQKQP